MFLEDNRIFVPFLTTCTVVHGREKGNPPTQIINLEIFDKDIQLFKSYTASSVATDTEVLKLDHNHKILLIIIIVLHKYLLDCIIKYWYIHYRYLVNLPVSIMS